MSSIKNIFSNLLFTLLVLASSSIYGKEVVVRAFNGNYLKLIVDQESSFASVMQQIQAILELSEQEQECYLATQSSWEESCLNDQGTEFCMDFLASASVNGHLAPTAIPRNYSAIVTPSEKKDINYIVDTLANASLKNLWDQEDSLNRAGDRINHVHPLRFLMVVFTDEKLKVDIRNIRNRGGKVWRKFIKGLEESLLEESQRLDNNMKPEYIQEFAAIVKINPALLFPSAQALRWGEFVQILIDKVPRSGDSGRLKDT